MPKDKKLSTSQSGNPVTNPDTVGTVLSRADIDYVISKMELSKITVKREEPPKGKPANRGKYVTLEEMREFKIPRPTLIQRLRADKFVSSISIEYGKSGDRLLIRAFDGDTVTSPLTIEEFFSFRQKRLGSDPFKKSRDDMIYRLRDLNIKGLDPKFSSADEKKRYLDDMELVQSGLSLVLGMPLDEYRSFREKQKPCPQKTSSNISESSSTAFVETVPIVYDEFVGFSGWQEANSAKFGPHFATTSGRVFRWSEKYGCYSEDRERTVERRCSYSRITGGLLSSDLTDWGSIMENEDSKIDKARTPGIGGGPKVRPGSSTSSFNKTEKEGKQDDGNEDVFGLFD